MGKHLSIWLGGDDPNQAAVLLISLKVVVRQSHDVAPRHQGVEADRRPLKGDPDIRAPAFGFGDVDQDRLDWYGLSDRLGQRRRDAHLDVAPRQWIEEQVPKSAVELDRTRANFDGSLVDLTVAQAAR